MKNKVKSRKELLTENGRLRLRAEQAEAALEASFKGEIDAIISPSSGKASLSTFPEMTYISGNFIEEMTEGAIVTDEDGIISYCNGSCAELLGRRKSELVGSNFSTHVAERSKEAYESCFGDSSKENRVVTVLYLLCRQNMEVPVSLSITPLVYQDVSRLCITIYDLREERRREQEIVEEKEKFETLFNHIGDAIFITSLDGKILEVNKTAYERLGYSREELIGRLVTEIDSPEYAEKAPQILEELSSSGAVTFESEHLSRSGERIPMEVHARRVFFEERDVVLAVARDITERKQAELAIRQSDKRYRFLFDSIRDAILVADTERNIVDCNTAFLMQFGYSMEEIRGKATSYVYASKEQFEELGRALRENIVESKPFLYTVNYREKNGKVFPGETGAFYLKDEKGQVKGFIGLIRDITERREIENALKSSEEFQRAIISTSPVAIHGIDTEDRVVVWNESCERVYGWHAEEVMGKALPSIPGDKREEHLAMLDRVISGEQLHDIEVERVRKNGERFYGSLSYAPLYDSQGALRGVVAIIADVTEKKKMEEQLRLSQKLDAVGRLAGGIAHDFNNMLMVIKGFSQIMRKKINPEESMYGHLMEIEKAVKRASDLTHQLLAYSRKQELQIEDVDINATLMAVRKMLEQLIGEHITIEMVLDDSNPRIRADINQLYQIIINLATNARDAMSDGGRLMYIVETVEIDAESRVGSQLLIASGTYVLLRVRDTGEGMNEDEVSHLFEPFYTTKKIGKGTGLGLATVYGTIKQLHAYIFCTSEVGKGTEFSLYFPSVTEGEVDAEELEGVPERRSGNETILLVEDEPMVREILSLTLRRRGYSVLEAEDGRSAWDTYQKNKKVIDLFVSDIIMPGENGLELARRINAEAPSLKMVFLTGYSETNTERIDDLTNQWKIFQKPVEPEEFLNELRKLLDAGE